MSPDKEKRCDVCMIGLGYIGLPTAAVIAGAGMHVVGVDISEDVVRTINAGEVHIEESDLDELVRDQVGSGRLVAATAPVASPTYLIAVPTPFTDDHRPDVRAVVQAAEAIAPHLRHGALVIVESTCPVGTTEMVRDRLAELRPDLLMAGRSEQAIDVNFAYCPERVLPGRILQELVANDRCIGGITPACAERAIAFYRTFVAGNCVATSARTAEMVKLVENASRDVSIAFANELSIVADRLEIDIWEVIAIANRHPRVNILNPGPGVGGHCIAVDPWFLVDSAPDITPLIRTAREVNDGKADYVAAKVESILDGQPELTLACLGLTFKPDIDDLRESPALAIAERLAARFAHRMCVVEPHIDELPPSLASTGVPLNTLTEAAASGGLALLLVDHAEFRHIDPTGLGFAQVYDTRGAWRGFGRGKS